MEAIEARKSSKRVGNRQPKNPFVRKWVIGTEFDGTRVWLRILDLQTGEVESGDFTKVGRYLQFDVPTQTVRRITIDLSSLEKVDSMNYAQVFRLPEWASSGQTAFELSRPRGKVVVPCQLLAGALFGVSPNARGRMLFPSGFGDLRFRSQRGTFEKPLRGIEKRTSEWVREHLSARASWTSIYATALTGTLDMTPPKAEVDVKLEGVRQGNLLFVTRLSIVTLRSRDHVQSSTTRVYEFRKPGTPRPMAHKPPVLFPELTGLSCIANGLSHEQWGAVLPLLATGNYPLKTPRKTCQRLEIALRKYGSPCAWLEAGARSDQEKEAAARLVRRLKKLGSWEQFVRRLWEAERECK
jgi:hypothetical protein